MTYLNSPMTHILICCIVLNCRIRCVIKGGHERKQNSLGLSYGYLKNIPEGRFSISGGGGECFLYIK